MRRVMSLLLALSFCFSVVFAEPYQGPSPWAKDEIQRGIEFEIFPEASLSFYQSQISRQDFCKLMVSMFIKESAFANVDDLLQNGLHYDFNTTQAKFKDLNYGNGDYKYVVAANLLGIVKGVSENSFAPQNSITREQAAKMLVSAYDRMLREKNISYQLQFQYMPFSDDDEISYWAKEEVYMMSKYGVMKGIGENVFDPKGTYSREQALLTTVRLYDAYRYSLDSNSMNKKMKEIDQGDIKEKGKVPKESDEPIAQLDVTDNQDSVLLNPFDSTEDENDSQENKDSFDSDGGNGLSGEANQSESAEANQSESSESNQPQSTEDFNEKLKNYKAEVLRLVNEERAKVGAPPLVECTKYNDYADLRAKECSVLFEHTRPDGTSCFSGLSDYLTVGENIAAGQSTPEFVMDSWMNSPGHKANILNPDFKELSIGVYYDGSSGYGWYWSQIFYTPYQ